MNSHQKWFAGFGFLVVVVGVLIIAPGVQAQVASSAVMTVVRGGPAASSGFVSGPGITCGTDCTEVFFVTSTQNFQLIAVPGSTTFVGWTGCDSVTGTLCSVMLAPGTSRGVGANFINPTTTPSGPLEPTLRGITSKIDTLERNQSLVLDHSFNANYSNYVTLAIVNVRGHENVGSISYLSSSSAPQAFVKAIERDCGSDAQQKISVWYLKNPISSSGTVNVIYSSGSVNAEGVVVMTYSGVDTVAPIGMVGGSCGAVGTALRTSIVATSLHSTIVALANKRRAIQNGILSTLTVPTGYVQRFNVCSGAGVYDDCYAVADKAALLGPENLTFTTNNSNNWATVALELKPPAAIGQIEDISLLASVIEALRLIIQDIQNSLRNS